MSTLIRGGTIVSANAYGDILNESALLIENNRVVSLTTGSNVRMPGGADVIDATGLTIIPGFVQTHIHLCQTLFRGCADDLQLLDWLKKRIFPFEAAHNEHSMRASALIGIAELIRSGTTTIVDMGSLGFEEEIIRAISETGLRAFVGKAMMDVNEMFPKLKESTQESVRSTRTLAERWHNSYDGRIKYAVAPRFVLSCSDRLMQEANEIAQNSDGVLFHTHASENTIELEAVRSRCGMENIEFLHSLGLLSKKSILAHCIHLNENEFDILKSTKSNVAHCPSSNLKLGSGIANVPQLLDRGIGVSLGADGAPCNNTLDMFQEMRLASLLQKPFHGPTALPARTVFEMATIGGARAVGLESELGSIEVGKKADLVLLDLRRSWNPIASNGSDLFSSIVYSASPENVDSVMIDGRWVYRKREFVSLDEEAIQRDAEIQLRKLMERM